LSEHYIDFDLFAFPDSHSGAQFVVGEGRSGILVLHTAADALSENQSLLENVFKAVQLAPASAQLFVLDVDQVSSVSAVALARHLGANTVYGFGVDWPRVGIRAQLPPYQFVRLGELTFFHAHAIDTIRKDREAKKNEKAGALWNAMKARYL
jgi:hypothetical protein